MISGIGNVLLASSLAALLATDAQGKFVVTERADVNLRIFHAEILLRELVREF
jgi:hypothetical protein